METERQSRERSEAKGNAHIHLVAGYSRSGKDTLFKILSEGGKIEDFGGDHRETKSQFKKWLIYSAKDTAKPNFGDHSKLKRVGFADALKEESFKVLGLTGKYQDYESEKDKKLVYPQYDPMSEPVPKLLRQHYIDHGSMRREQDIDYWAKAALNPFKDDLGHVIVTDFRFLNENAHAVKNFITNTTRVFNSQVRIAPKDVVSEHDLDDFLTDYLLVHSEEEFTKALVVFPQYSHFIPKWCLIPN